jgi:hypothetical protein
MSVTTAPVSICGAFIASLRARAPIFNGRIAGAAEFYKGLRDYSTSLPLPAAYVLPLGQEAEPNLVMNGLVQVIRKQIGIAVELDAQRDRRGQDPAMVLEAIEAQLFASCLGLMIDECRMSRGTSFVGARYLDLDRARLWYQWEFGLDWQITDADGVQPDSVPLANIEVDIFGPYGVPPTGTMPAAVILMPTGEPPIPPATDGPWPASTATSWDGEGTIWDAGTTTWDPIA